MRRSNPGPLEWLGMRVSSRPAAELNNSSRDANQGPGPRCGRLANSRAWLSRCGLCGPLNRSRAASSMRLSRQRWRISRRGGRSGSKPRRAGNRLRFGRLYPHQCRRCHADIEKSLEPIDRFVCGLNGRCPPVGHRGIRPRDFTSSAGNNALRRSRRPCTGC